MQKRLAQLLKEYLATRPEYTEAFQIVRRNSIGKIWLIGGFVFRSLAQTLYGAAPPKKDVDFLVESLRDPLKLPREWSVEENLYGNPKLRKGDLAVDVVPLTNILLFRERNRKPSIMSYLAIVPLTVQSIAYDTAAEALIGEVGMASILNRTVGVHNPNSLERKCETTKNPNYHGDLAASLGFTFIGENIRTSMI